MTTTRLSSAALALAFCSLGCEPVEDALANFDTVDTCRADLGNANVAGSWNLSGTGSRHSCGAPFEHLNTDLFSLSARGLVFTQAADGKLTIGSPTGLLVGLTGEVSGSCVRFTVRDTDPRTNLATDYRFDGVLQSFGELAGDFEIGPGAGPGICQGEGRFVGKPSQ
ncbi:MAG: hypothetical protein IV100_15270 [Myxococcales bacterium]|nr:hypothetical protein [Myxococcales bacterium]